MGEGIERRVQKLEDAVGEPGEPGQCQCRYDVEGWKREVQALRDGELTQEQRDAAHPGPGAMCPRCGKIIGGDRAAWERWRERAAKQRAHVLAMVEPDYSDPNAP